MYKFEIHRNPNTPRTDSYTDTVRYDSDDYVFERMITPVWNNLSFKWGKDDGRAFFRKKLDGDFSLIADDYDWVNEIRLGSDSGKYRILIIKEKQNGVWIEVWRGFFSIIVGKWNLDNCSVKFSDLIVWDEYTILLENMEKEKNLLDVQAAFFSLHYYENEYKYDTYTTSGTETIETDGCHGENNGFKSPTIAEAFIDDNYVLVEKGVVFYGVSGGFDPEDPSQWDDSYIFNYTYEYRRDYVIQVNNPGGWTDLGVYPPDSGNPEHKYVRNYRGITDVSYSATAYNPFSYYWMDSLGAIFTCDSYRNRDYFLITSAEDLTSSTNRARQFRDVVWFMLDEYGISPDFSFKSSFFNNLTNPITGELNELRFLHIFQILDLTDTSDPATKALYSFNDIEKWIKLLNCYWYINSDGEFQIEHLKYFNNGLTYGDQTYDIEIPKSDKIIKKFSYKNKSLPRIESFIVNNVGMDDFWGVPMVYASSLANWGDDNIIDYDFDIFTDMAYVLEHQDSVGKDGFVLVAVELTDNGFYVISDIGEITGMVVLNEPLSASGVQENYWKYGRPLDVGFMNNKSTVFDSVEGNFIQDEIITNYCDELDPYKLVKTEYGEGRIETASLTLKDKQLTLSLSYQ